MNKKYTIIIIVILLLFIGFAEYSKMSNEKKVINIKGTNFTIPDKYYKSGLNENGDINITNGTNSLFIGHYNETKKKKHINDYFNYCTSHNQSATFSNLTIENIIVYKTVINQNNFKTYWFEKNNQTYLCYYSVKEHNNLIFTIKSDNFEFEVCDVYKDFLKKM